MEENKINTYEISFLVNSPADAGVIMKHLSDFKAEVVAEGAVSELNLAYPIQKKITASFGYVHFKLAASSLASLNDALRLDKSIIRFLIITPPPKKSPRPRIEGAPARPRSASNDLSNEALGEKLAALQGK